MVGPQEWCPYPLGLWKRCAKGRLEEHRRANCRAQISKMCSLIASSFTSHWARTRLRSFGLPNHRAAMQLLDKLANLAWDACCFQLVTSEARRSEAMCVVWDQLGRQQRLDGSQMALMPLRYQLNSLKSFAPSIFYFFVGQSLTQFVSAMRGSGAPHSPFPILRLWKSTLSDFSSSSSTFSFLYFTYFCVFASFFYLFFGVMRRKSKENESDVAQTEILC